MGLSPYERGLRRRRSVARIYADGAMNNIKWFQEEDQYDFMVDEQWESRSWAYDLPGVHDGPELCRGTQQVRDQHGQAIMSDEPFYNPSESLNNAFARWEQELEPKKFPHRTIEAPVRSPRLCLHCDTPITEGRRRMFCDEVCRLAENRARLARNAQDKRQAQEDAERQARHEAYSAAYAETKRRREATRAARERFEARTLESVRICPPEPADGPVCHLCDEVSDPDGELCDVANSHASCRNDFEAWSRS